MHSTFNTEDASQVTVGAFALAVPISFTEEAWRMGETLPISNLIALITVSIAFLSLFTYQSVFQGSVRNRLLSYISRIFLAYFIAALVVAVTLLCLNKLPMLTDPIVSIKRVLIITMPASIGAIVVDSMDKE